MPNFEPNDRVRVLDFNSTEESGIVGRKGIVTDFAEEGEGGDPDLNLYHVELEGNDDKAGEWLLAERELEFVY